MKVSLRNEMMWLYPPVLSHLQCSPEAETGSGGLYISNHFFSEDTAVLVTPYAIQRSPQHFSPSPNTFWPDRWLPSPECFPSNISAKDPVVMKAMAFIPFSYRFVNCTGKALAMVELRMVVALVVQRIEMQFKEGFEFGRWEERFEDYFVLRIGEVPVVLMPRV
jgi:cytochrome P450